MTPLIKPLPTSFEADIVLLNFMGDAVVSKPLVSKMFVLLVLLLLCELAPKFWLLLLLTEQLSSAVVGEAVVDEEDEEELRIW